MGTLADRMAALRGKGMDLGDSASGNKRSSMQSQPLSAPPPSSRGSAGVTTTTIASSSGRQAGQSSMSVTGGAGIFGLARTPAIRSRANSSASASTDSERRSRRPSNPPKPSPKLESAVNLATSPSAAEDKNGPVRATATGSSAKSARSAGGGREAEGSGSNPLSPAHSGNMSRQSTTGPSSKPGLPTILQRTPSSSANQPPPSGSPPAQAEEGNNSVAEFEKAFPSLSEFGKQFGDDDGPNGLSGGVSGLPNGSYSNGQSSRHDKPEEDDDELAFPVLPSFPSLPSVPGNKPGASTQSSSAKSPLPPPPSKPSADLGIPGSAASIGPPSPDSRADIARPASVPNGANLLGNDEDGSSDALPPSNAKKAPPPIASKPSMPTGSGPSAPPAKLSFPAAKPSGPGASSSTSPAPDANVPGPSKEPLQLPPKPNFPFSNSVEPELLRSYLLHPSAKILLLDARTEEDFRKGYVGKEYEAKGYAVHAVWLDPTVLMRSE